MNSFKKRIVHGAIWMIVARLIVRILGVVNIAVLARLLTPADFGLVAAAWTALSLLSVVTAFDFDAVLVQRASVSARDYSTAFTLKLVFGLLVTISGAMLAGVIANFFGEPQLQPVVVALSFSVLARALHNTWLVEYRRNLTFSREFLMDIVPVVTTLIATLVAAVMIRNYWALVIGTLIGHMTGMVLSYMIHGSRPRISFVGAFSFFDLSKWVMLNTFLNYIDTKLADILIGKNLGTNDLGLFRMGSQMAALATTEFAEPVNRVLFPGYSRVSHDSVALRRTYLKSFAVLVYVGMPIAIGVFAVAEPLVLVVLGTKWAAVTPVLELMALHGAVNLLLINDYAVYMSKGRPKVMVFLYIPYVILLVPILYYLTKEYGINGSAASFLIADLISFPLYILVLLKTLAIGFVEFIRSIWRSLIGCGFMLISIRFFLDLAEKSIGSELLLLLAAVAVGGASYLFLTLSSWYLLRAEISAESQLFGLMRDGIFSRNKPESVS